MMDRRAFIAVVGGGSILAAPLAAEAQRPPEVRRIGFLQGGISSAFYENLRHSLRGLGYLEGRNLLIEYRSGENQDRLAELAAELIRLNVEVIVTPGTAVWAAKGATKSIPIVFSVSGDPSKPASSRASHVPMEA